MLHHSDKRLGKHHHRFRWTSHSVTADLLRRGRRLDWFETVTQEVGAKGAHEVDVLVAIHIPEPRALCTAEELRIFIG